MKKYILLAFMFLSSCSALEVKTAPLKFPEVTAPTIVPMNTKTINIKTATVNGNVLYTLTPDNMENLDNNIIEMRRYILSQGAQIIFYQNLNKSVETTIDEYNKKNKK